MISYGIYCCYLNLLHNVQEYKHLIYYDRVKRMKNMITCYISNHFFCTIEVNRRTFYFHFMYKNTQCFSMKNKILKILVRIRSKIDLIIRSKVKYIYIFFSNEGHKHNIQVFLIPNIYNMSILK